LLNEHRRLRKKKNDRKQLDVIERLWKRKQKSLGDETGLLMAEVKVDVSTQQSPSQWILCSLLSF